MMKFVHPTAIVLFVFFSLAVVSQETKIDQKILDEACECIKKIPYDLSTEKKTDSIQSCITASIISDQTTKLVAEMGKTIDTLIAVKKDTVIGNNRSYTITVDKDLDIIKAKLFSDCPAMKSLMTTENQRYKNSVSDKKKAVEFYNQGDKYITQKKYDLALVEYNKAVKADPKFAFAWDNLGVCYRQLGRYDEAIKCYEKSLALDPEGKMPLMNIAVAQALKTDYKSAIATYNKFIALHPEDPEGFYGIARIQNTTGDYENALENAFKAYAIYMNQSSPYDQDAINVLKEIVSNIRKEGKTEIYNTFAEKHGLKKIEP